MNEIKYFDYEKDRCSGVVAIRIFDKEGNVIKERNFKKAKSKCSSLKKIAAKVKNKAAKKNLGKKNRK